MIDINYMFNTNFKNQKELFKNVTEYLSDQHYVTSDFEQALKDREKEFATGLPTDPPVAIPHTDGTYVLKDTLLIVKNNNEIHFNEMGGDDDDYVTPKVFILFAIKNGENHLQMLQNIIELIQEGDFVSTILHSNTSKELETNINTYLTPDKLELKG